MLEAAAHGAVPSDGPGSKSFKSGNAEYVESIEYEEEQRNVLRGRLEAKIESLNARHWVLEGKGQFELADRVDYERNRYRMLLDEIDSEGEASRNPVGV